MICALASMALTVAFAQGTPAKSVFYKIEVLGKRGIELKPSVRTLEGATAEFKTRLNGRDLDLKMTPKTIEGDEITNEFGISVIDKIPAKGDKPASSAEANNLITMKLHSGDKVALKVTKSNVSIVSVPKKRAGTAGDMILIIQSSVVEGK